jgi:membrane protein implicated in regulation of membrane protease activity
MKEKIGKFSLRRWGLGSLAILAILVSLGSTLLFEWSVSHSAAVLVAASTLFLLGGVVFVVKITEEIHPYHPRGGIAGSHGTVVREISGALPGVVKIEGQLWSAKSHQVLDAGERVRVERTEGLYAWVEKST